MAGGHGQPECPEKERDGDDAIEPAIEPPLVLPEPHGVAVERAEVEDRPQVLGRGAAGADEVAEQVEMKYRQREQGNAPAAAGENCQNRCNQDSAEKTVQEIMMIALVPVETGSFGAGRLIE